MLAWRDASPVGHYIRVIEISDVTDLCLLEGVPGAKGLELADGEQGWDEQLTIIGHPRLEPLTISQGGTTTRAMYQINDNVEGCTGPTRRLVQGDSPFGPFAQCIRTLDAYMTTVRIFPGSSGSPMFNHTGQVVGVAFASDNDSNNALTIPWNHLMKFVGGRVRAVNETNR